jgi:hypothetical protein
MRVKYCSGVKLRRRRHPYTFSERPMSAVTYTHTTARDRDVEVSALGDSHLGTAARVDCRMFITRQ